MVFFIQNCFSGTVIQQFIGYGCKQASKLHLLNSDGLVKHIGWIPIR